MKKIVTARLLPLLMAAALLAGICSVPAAAAQSAASDVTQLTMTEGTVRVVNSYGRELTVNDGMRLYNGTRVLTAAASYAWLDLDSAKAVKLDASSAAQLRRSGLRQEVLLESGALFFNAAEPPVDQQTLCLRTADAAAFVDGACGFVERVDRWNTLISVLDGQVAYTVADPVTGQRLTGTVDGGQTVMLTVSPQDHAGDKCAAKTQQLLFYEIGGYVLEELSQDMDVCGRMYAALNVDVLPPLGLLGSIAQMLDEVMMRPAQVRGQLQEEGGTEELLQSLSQLQEQLEQIWKLLDEAGLSSQTAKQGLQQVQALQQAARQAADDGDLLSAVEQLEDSRQALEQVVQYAGAAAQAESLDVARERLVQDQVVDRELQAVIDEQLKTQENNISQDPVWKEPEPTATPAPTEAPASGAGGGAGGGSYVPAPTPVPTPRVFVMGEFTLDELQRALYTSSAGVIVLPNEDPDKNTLTIEPGKTLAVPSKQTLTLDGDINIVTKQGDTLDGNGKFIVQGTLSAPNSTITNGGMMMVPGKVDSGPITQKGGKNALLQVSGDAYVAGGIVLRSGMFNMSGGQVRHGIEQVRSTGEDGGVAEEDGCTARVSGGVITGGYYYHYELDEDKKNEMTSDKSDAKDEARFNLTISGGTIQYVEDEAPGGIKSALVMENDAFASKAQVAVSGGAIDGGEGPAIAASGSWKNKTDITKDATVKGGVPELVELAEDFKGTVTFNGKEITADSYLVTEQQEDDSYILTDVTTFADMLEKAESGQIVTLDKDRTLSGTLTIPEGVTLDLNGHTLELGDNTITLGGSLTVKGEGTISANGPVFKLNGNDYVEKTWDDVLTIAEGVTVKTKDTDKKFVVDSSDTAVVNPSGYKVSEEADSDSYYTLTKDPDAAGAALTSQEDEPLPEDEQVSPDPDASENPEDADKDTAAEGDVSNETEDTEGDAAPDETDASEEEEKEPSEDGEPADDTEPSDDAGPTDDAEPSDDAEPTGDTEDTPETAEPAGTEEPTPANSENSEEVDA